MCSKHRSENKQMFSPRLPAPTRAAISHNLLLVHTLINFMYDILDVAT